jgi:hypothetical protein
VVQARVRLGERVIEMEIEREGEIAIEMKMGRGGAERV